MTGPRPGATAAEAVSRAWSLLGRGTYLWGADDAAAEHLVFDCFRYAVNYCYRIPTHRPGYNQGGWATVSDDTNSNSAIEDAKHRRDLFELVADLPREGDIIAYPTIRLPGVDAGPWPGHAVIVTGVSRTFVGWDPAKPVFRNLDILECVGPNGNHPAIRRSTGQGIDQHNETWSKPEHRAYLLRVRP
jgi:hypothetical protein